MLFKVEKTLDRFTLALSFSSAPSNYLTWERLFFQLIFIKRCVIIHARTYTCGNSTCLCPW